MLKCLLYTLLSNAFFEPNKLIYIFFIYNYINSVNIIILQASLTLFLLFVLYIILVFVFGLKNINNIIFIFFFSSIYLWSIKDFIIWCDINYINSVFKYIIILMSLITVLIIIKNGFQKSFWYEILIKFFLVPKIFIICIILTVLIFTLFRSLILGNIDCFPPISSYSFIVFSMTIPRTVLYRIVYNSVLFFLITDAPKSSSSFITIICAQIINPSNIRLDNILFSKTMLIIYTLCPLLDICYSIVLFSGKDTFTYLDLGVEQLYDSYSFENKSHPSQMEFKEEIYLDTQYSYTENELKNHGAGIVPRRVGGGGGLTTQSRYLLNDDQWVRSNGNIFFKESYIKSRFTSSINLFMHINDIEIGGYKINKNVDYTKNIAIINELHELANHNNDESKVDSLIATLLPIYFGVNRGYSYCPQASIFDEERYARYKVDYMVKHCGSTVLIVEDKTSSSSAESTFDLMEQAHNYARSNQSHEVAFVAIVKGTNISFFLYDRDFHTKNDMDLKCEGLHDLIGLEVNNRGIGLVTQYNTFYPQLKIYDLALNAPKHNKLAIVSILSHISQCQKAPSITDNFTLPPTDSNKNIFIGTSLVDVGVKLRLNIDPFGKFKQVEIS